MTAEVHTLYDAALDDVPAMLRKMADRIEANGYGDISRATLVLFGDQLTVHGFGRGDVGDTFLQLAAAQLRLASIIEQHGKP